MRQVVSRWCHIVEACAAKSKQTVPPLVIHSLPFPPLTWALCEVVEAAVLGPDAALVAVACPIHTVHPPVGGQAAQVSAPAAFP